MKKVVLCLIVSGIIFTAHPASAQCNATKPTGLFADNISSCEITLHWDAIPSIGYYKLKYKKSNGGGWTSVPGNIVTTSYTFPGLTGNTLYNFRVISHCSSAVKSKPGKISVQTTACSIPVLSPIVLDNANNIHLSWTTGCNSFTSNQVRYRMTTSSSWNYVNSGSSTSATLSGLDSNAIYVFQILACTDTSSWSSIDTFRMTTQPNILVILLDDARFDSYSCNGAPSWFQSPGIDRIANEGVNFKNNFAVYSECAPSRATLYTGLYPHSSGAFNNHHDYNPNLPTIGSILHANSYYTAMMGKFLKEELTNTPQPGWDFWMAKTAGGKTNPVYDHNGQIILVPGSELDILTDTFLHVFRDHVNRKPILAVVAYNTPHEPYQPLPQDAGAFANETMPFPADFIPAAVPVPNFYLKLADSYHDSAVCRKDWEGYYESMLGMDRAVTDILDTIGNYAPLKKFMIIFTSDNGHLLGEHELNGKLFPYNESMRVPLFIRYPKWFPAGTVNTSIPALNLDLAPTILDAAGIPNSYGMQGFSLHNLYQGTSKRTVFYYEGIDIATALYPDFRTVQSAQYSYSKYFCDSVIEQFFDLTADPLELTNQIYNPAYSAQLDAYRHLLDSFKVVFHDTLLQTVGNCFETLQRESQMTVLPGSMDIYPNPADEFINVQLPVAGKIFSGDLFTDEGKLVKHMTIPSGLTSFRIEVSDLHEGMYVLMLHSDAGVWNKKLSIIHPK